MTTQTEEVNSQSQEKKLSHPYMDTLKKTLDKHYHLLKLYEKRITLLKDSYESKNEFDKNESDIIEIKTEREIFTLKSVIKEKERYFSEYIQQFVKDKKEMDENYDELLKKAKSLSNPSKYPAVHQLLNSVKWDAVDADIEVKLHLYKRLKTSLGIK